MVSGRFGQVLLKMFFVLAGFRAILLPGIKSRNQTKKKKMEIKKPPNYLHRRNLTAKQEIRDVALGLD